MAYNNICISIGAYTAKELNVLLGQASNTLVYYFDPNPNVAAEFKQVFNGCENVIFQQVAVSYRAKQQKFYLCGQVSSLQPIKDSESIIINTISLSQILRAVIGVHGPDTRKILAMNCEGEEVPIILNTSLENLSQFDLINVEFHPDNNSEHDEDRCWNKLCGVFEKAVRYGSVSKHPRYSFRKRV